ncbi:TylF/MycF/NovP-related O-methyltransferase [Sphingosinicella sp. LHD-64]|uniref:TylF/MycF/NovP-related O-methyltransferase n=1 Tax=Sphingosinicella sp. LHD-64 TaxID=3072139 RepID=UPI00280D2A54|nr:TylF/MycF/NovP-related O-methyltransferase [Sphingosinicella sp. LHD-64]MDQ8755155.1 TylF/MycF/NovP-related O-methyltransferase [Sphingosinicella sp. LHD-64]
MLRGMRGRAHRLVDFWSLSPLARSVLRRRLTYLHPGKLRHIERRLHETIGAGVPGDIIEFGVALGGSTVLLAREASAERRFYGLDVFGMIPEPTSLKDDAKSKQRYQDIVERRSIGIGGDPYYGYRHDLYEHACTQLLYYGTPMDGERIRLVKGLFEETWPTLGVDRIAFAHIDCDWYDPVRFCLGETARRLSLGGAIVIDDYHDYEGCRTAVDEFIRDNPGFELVDARNPVVRHRRA